MPDSQELGNSQTLWVQLDELNFETVEQSQGYATVIRFELLNLSIKIGDVLVVMEGSEIRFHGMIGDITDGWATVGDRRGSSIPSGLQ